MSKRRPGEVRDAIVEFLQERQAASVAEIASGVAARLSGDVKPSSVRSYLRLNTPDQFERSGRGCYSLQAESLENGCHDDGSQESAAAISFGKARLYRDDCFAWLSRREPCSIHAVVTDPPYALVEYSAQEQSKLRSGKGGVWRIPPSFDGHKRSPLPRFTTLRDEDKTRLRAFFGEFGRLLRRVLVPGGHVFVASNPLLSFLVANEMDRAGLERRGEIIRLVMTMRGGDRPKNAHEEFAEVTVMPRSQWEPWLLFRRPLEGRVSDNLRRWGTGGLRRPSEVRPFGDVIKSAPTHKTERAIAPHPSLKPQKFLRQVVRASLPLGEGIVLDPFAGSGSTLAAAEALGYESIGIESDEHYVDVARSAIPRLAAMAC